MFLNLRNILIIFCSMICLNAFSIKTDIKDSISYVASTFMQYDVFISSYKVFDEDLEWVEKNHHDWVINYFEKIYIKYDCTLYSKFALSISLYNIGKKQYLKELWKKYRYLFFIDSKRNEDENVKKIWDLIDCSKIKME